MQREMTDDQGGTMKAARSRVRLGIMCIWVATSASFGLSQEAARTQAGMEPDRLARIPARMQEFVDRGTHAGAVTLVARHGEIVSLRAVGYQDLETKTPMRTDTIFQARSMTKSVTAVGVMILAEEGRLTLGDALEKYLPDFRGLSVIENHDSQGAPVLKPASRSVTIYDLLTHTSGMAPGLTQELLAEVRQEQTLAERPALAARMPLGFQPGTKFSYSGIGYIVLGRVIEVASGQAYEKFIEERIFTPLGMKDSSVLPPLEKLDRVASTYERRDGKLVKANYYDIGTYQTLNVPRPSSSMFSTASDLFAFYQMMLNGGEANGRRILSPASVEVMTLCHTMGLESLSDPFETGTHYGLGWYVACSPEGTQQLQSIGSFGHGGLLNTRGWVDPRKQMVTVFLTSRAPTPEEGSAFHDEVHAFLALAGAAVAK